MARLAGKIALVTGAARGIGAAIITLSSRSGQVGVAGAAAYAAAKAAVGNHSKTVALYCAEQGLAIRRNSLHPGAILTPMWDAMVGDSPEREANLAAFVHDTPLRRFGHPEEVAAVAVMLASDYCAYMTGSELTIDGGLLAGSAEALGGKTKVAENKTKPTSASVDDFIAGIENARRRSDALLALSMYKEVTGLPPVMWGPSIIGFGTHHYVYDSGREGAVPAAGFSPRKANMTFYVGDKFEGAKALYARLGKHKKSVACLYVNKLDDVDLQVLREIVARDYAATLQNEK